MQEFVVPKSMPNTFAIKTISCVADGFKSETLYASPVPQGWFGLNSLKSSMKPQKMWMLKIQKTVSSAPVWHSSFGLGAGEVAQPRRVAVLCRVPEATFQ
jgi:hypothetical protein